MPAAVHLPGRVLMFKSMRTIGNADAARMLTDLLTNELQKYDKKLQVKPTAPDEMIHCTIMTFTDSPACLLYAQRSGMQKGKKRRSRFNITKSRAR